MRIDRRNIWNQFRSEDNTITWRVDSANFDLAQVTEDQKRQFRQRESKESRFLDKTISQSRVIVIEGISGSGKDTFQGYLKRKLKGRDVYDYSEGELLQSWNQLQIGGISKLRVRLMKLFVNYIKEIVDQEENAVFLLNRFHLSTFVMTIIKESRFQKEYDEIISVLKTLPVHVFILRLNENEIEQRSFHPERSSVWQRFQQQIAKRDGFHNKLERYVWQQKMMIETAERQKIPYSVIDLFTSFEGEHVISVPEIQKNLRSEAQLHSRDAKTLHKKRGVPHAL